MKTITLAYEYLQELESEVKSTRRCLEAIPERLYEWKPHERSMTMGYLALLVADIPRWISESIERSEIDFATYEQFKLSTTAALLEHFDRNIEQAKRALTHASSEEFDSMFYLKNSGTVLFSATKHENTRSTLNHWVHHRGQLTVYMRLNEIAVPSIYGPSADERTF